MNPNAHESKKDETFWRVLNAAVELDFKRGHQRWSMSELSRMSKITRSLIYYYFGKSKEAILLEAVKLVGEDLFGLNPARLQMWKEGRVAESVIQSRRMLDKSSHLASFYMVHRYSNSEIGNGIRLLEKEYKEKIKKFISSKKNEDIDALYGVFFGLVVTPGLSDEGVRKAVEVINRIIAEK